MSQTGLVLACLAVTRELHCKVSYTWQVRAWDRWLGQERVGKGGGGGGGLPTLSLIILGGGDKSSFSQLSTELGDLDRHLREQEVRLLNRCMHFDLCTLYHPSELQETPHVLGIHLSLNFCSEVPDYFIVVHHKFIVLIATGKQTP